MDKMIGSTVDDKDIQLEPEPECHHGIPLSLCGYCRAQRDQVNQGGMDREGVTVHRGVKYKPGQARRSRRQEAEELRKLAAQFQPNFPPKQIVLGDTDYLQDSMTGQIRRVMPKLTKAEKKRQKREKHSDYR